MSKWFLFAGADIKNVTNQAALRAAADQVDSVSMKHLEAARDKVLMGKFAVVQHAISINIPV